MKRSAYLAALSTVLLAACGGGGSSSTATSTTASTDTFAALKATYAVACTGDTLRAQDGTITKLESSQGTITIATASGSNATTVSLRSQYYVGSTDCAASTLNTDLTANGQLSDKGTTKNYTDATGKTVTAKVATFTYTGMTLSKGNLSISLPTAGTTTDIAYVLDGSNLYVTKGVRGADGLGDSLSRAAVKQ